jgi:DNA-binding NarL/FixJ family response regulator
MIIRVLIINRQLVFAVTIKQALEQTGAFEVHPFTDPNAAMDYLRTHPHDVALVDFAIKVMPGAEIVRGLREIQPELAVIVSPMQPDSSKVIRDLSLQGMIDAPFSARGIIPLIEHAVEQMSQPTQAITRSLVEPEQHGAGDTEVLGRTEPGEPFSLPPRSEQVHTRILEDEPDDAAYNPPHTRILDDQPENLPQTRNLGGADRAQTRILDDEPENLPPTRDLSDRDRIPTRNLREQPAQPPALPGFSTLNDVLADEAPSSLFEPPVRDGDTPSVPHVDSDAVRQFLATSQTPGDRLFDSMLTEIKPEDTELPPKPPQLPGGDFENLVNSMRGEQQHTPLPDRHQQFVEFILTGGMDSLLSEIEKAKTGPLDDEHEAPELPPPPRKLPPAPTTLEKLAAEEPPPPALEEGGTVSDLMVGVSDTSFRNVLAMMRGDDVVDSDVDIPPAPTRQEIEAAYAAFFEKEVADDDLVGQPPVLPEAEPDDEPASITAQLILETALDESTPVDSFSLDDVIGTIERQLAQHQPDIKPLPSWQIKSLKPKEPPQAEPPEQKPRSGRRTDRYIKEPDFLPEEFPEPTAEMDSALEEPPEPVSETVWEMIRQTQEFRASVEDVLKMDDLQAAIEDEPDSEEYDWATDDETVLGAELDAGIPEMLRQPDTLPEDDSELDLAFDAPDTLPGDLWDDLSQQDWEVESGWDGEPSVEAVTPPAELPGFEDDWELAIDDAPEEETIFMERPHLADEPVALGAAADFEPQASAFDVTESDDPYIAQIALSLTQVSLELATEATLLTSDDQIIAFAGHLEQADVEELRTTLADDWAASDNRARIRFVTLPGSGKDYMLYSRKTVNDFTLTMIFSGTTALRDIRRQGRRLMEALESVPEAVAEAPPESLPELAMMTGEVPAVEPAVAAAVTMQPFTYLWLLRDPSTTLEERTERAIVAGLGLQLGELGWRVKSLRAHGEYVYVHAEVPGERPAYEVIDDLKRRAGEIAHAQEPSLQGDSLWADSYLVMMPGRELDPDEIDQFISFERMA